MATFRHRDGKWQAQICVNGIRRSRTFALKTDAKNWAAREEILLSGNTKKLAGMLSLSELVDNFIADYGEERHTAVFARILQKSPLAGLPVSQITEKAFCQYADSLRQTLNNNSFIRYVGAFSVVFNFAVKKGFMLSNPTKAIERPRPEPHRERIATDAEIALLMDTVHWREDQPPNTNRKRIIAAFLLSCLTGMRGGEILQIRREWIEGNVIHLPAPATKTRTARDVALSSRAAALVRLVESQDYGNPIFALSEIIKNKEFQRIRDKAGLGIVRDGAGNVLREALHFHDGRATFCTNAAKRLDVLSLARQLGHSDLKMLQRYYRPSAKDLARLLD